MSKDKNKGPGADVTVLSSRDIRKPESLLSQIEGYWRELLAQSRGVPRRADLDAARIGGALPHAFILERVAGVGRIRIAGQGIAALLGAEVRGVPLSVLFTPEARPAIQSWLDRCFAGPALVDLGLASSQGPLRATVKGRLLLLPLLDAEGEVTRAVGGLLLDGPARSGPMRFDIPAGALRCEPVTVPAAPRPFASAPDPESHGFSEPARPYLRLVVSNS